MERVIAEAKARRPPRQAALRRAKARKHRPSRSRPAARRPRLGRGEGREDRRRQSEGRASRPRPRQAAAPQPDAGTAQAHPRRCRRSEASVKKKEEGPKPTDASGHALVKACARGRRSDHGGDGVFRQLSVASSARILEVCGALSQDAETPFDLLCDLTCVHYPENFDAPFEIVYNSIDLRERARALKVATTKKRNRSGPRCGRRPRLSAKSTTSSA